MKEVPGVAVVEGLHQLEREALDVLLSELDHATLQETHQVVVTVLKHQVERPCVREGGDNCYTDGCTNHRMSARGKCNSTRVCSS